MTSIWMFQVTVESVPPSEAVATETPAGEEGAGIAEVPEEETAVAADEGGTSEEAGEAIED